MTFAFLFLALAVLATLSAGLLALKLKKSIRMLAAFSAGLLIGVAFFDLMPDAFQAAGASILPISTAIALGFLAYLVLEKFVLMHSCSEPEGCKAHMHSKGFLGVSGLFLHRIIDGIVLGFSATASPATAVLIGTAITVHSIPDGINSAAVLLMKNSSSVLQWVVGISLAMALGFALAILVPIPNSFLSLLLGFVAGWFIYLGASDLIPEAHREKSAKALLLTILGFALAAMLAVLFAG